MVNEVNKLIYNSLLKCYAIYLPSVGTLSVVRRSATFSSKNELLPPRFGVEYSSNNCAKSLIDIISVEVGVDAKRAEEIYSRWLDRVREGSVVVIESVGVLRDKGFEADEALIKTLNIYSEPLRVTRCKTKASLYVTLTLILICVICAGSLYYLSSKPVTTPVGVVAEGIVESPQELPLVVEVEQIEEEIIEEVQIIEDIVVDWRTRDDIHHWVVVGSYSTIENAERAISEIVKRLPDMQCDYFKLGSMYAVSVFGSADIAECQQFKSMHIKDFTQSWVYTPKRFR